MSDEISTPIIAGRYQLGERLAKGGMGTVFYGHDPQTNEQAALQCGAALDLDEVFQSLMN